MFSKKQRIPRKTIEQIFKKPKKVLKNDSFFVYFIENSLPYPRFAVVIPKKQTKTSVKRNLYKRLAFLILEKENISKNYDLIVYLKRFTENFKQDLEEIINKI